jgi:hypothetical protein
VRLPTKVMVVSPAIELSIVMSDVVFGSSPRGQPDELLPGRTFLSLPAGTDATRWRGTICG